MSDSVIHNSMMNGTLVTVIIAALVGSAATLLTQRLLEQPLQLATADPGVLVAEHLQSIDANMTEDAIKARSQAFAQRLDAAVTYVAKQYHVVLLVKPSVITGVPDLTDEVRWYIHEPAH